MARDLCVDRGGRYDPVNNNCSFLGSPDRSEVTPTPVIYLGREIPVGILSGQLTYPHSIEGVDFLIYRKSSRHFFHESNGEAGVLYAEPDSTKWKVLLEIEDSSIGKNNPYLIGMTSDKYYLLIIDDRGAGSGEGVGKLISIDRDSGLHSTDRCFYYGDYGFDWATAPSDEVPAIVDEYVRTHKDSDMETSDPDCQNFKIRSDIFK